MGRDGLVIQEMIGLLEWIPLTLLGMLTTIILTISKVHEGVLIFQDPLVLKDQKRIQVQGIMYTPDIILLTISRAREEAVIFGDPPVMKDLRKIEVQGTMNMPRDHHSRQRMVAENMEMAEIVAQIGHHLATEEDDTNVTRGTDSGIGWLELELFLCCKILLHCY